MHMHRRSPAAPELARTNLCAHSPLRALSVIRAAGVRKHVGGAVGRRCVYDVQALSLITMRVLRQSQRRRAMRVCVVREGVLLVIVVYIDLRSGSIYSLQTV